MTLPANAPRPRLTAAPSTPSPEELARALGCASFARAPKEGELGQPCEELKLLIKDGEDERAALAIRQNPQLAHAEGSWASFHQGLFGVIEPLAILAAERCCFETAKAALEAGFNPALTSAKGWTILIAACLGVGVQSQHRLLDRHSPEEWAQKRMDFLDWLWERESQFGLHAQGMSARRISASLSKPHCRVVFRRCVESGSLHRAMSKKNAIHALDAAETPAYNDMIQWCRQSLLEDLATRDGDFTGEFMDPVMALVERSTPKELRAAAIASKKAESPNLDLFEALAEKAELDKKSRPGQGRARARL